MRRMISPSVMPAYFCSSAGLATKYDDTSPKCRTLNELSFKRLTRKATLIPPSTNSLFRQIAEGSPAHWDTALCRFESLESAGFGHRACPPPHSL